MAIVCGAQQTRQLMPSQAADSILIFNVQKDRPDYVVITVTIPHDQIVLLLDYAAKSQKKDIKALGFDHGNAPVEFIKQAYQTSLLEHLKEFLFKYCILNSIYRFIREAPLVIAGEPRISKITLTPSADAQFHFECTSIEDITIHEWRYFPFRAPKRKNYKDLDRQVENFIAEELGFCEKIGSRSNIQKNDWIALEIELTDNQGVALIPNFAQVFWLQISDELVDNPLRDLLCNKQVGFCTVTQNKGLQDYFSEQLAIDYWYKITILAHIPHGYFCFEQFKYHFKIKTKKELLKKLIEVFSYRNDLSQRRATVEDCLKLLLAKHPFNVPSFVKTRFQEELLLSMHESPDYNVYRTQKEFNFLIERLAEKAAKESLFIDALAAAENIIPIRDDLIYYLNCTKRGRTKEFIYFEAPTHIEEGQSTFIAEEELMRYCLREKTLNHVIYHLTKE